MNKDEIRSLTVSAEHSDINSGKDQYKSYVGPPDRYDFMGATQFRLLTSLGLRQTDKLLDFGCGSLRSGKLFIPYLGQSNYFGIEPNKWLVEAGLANELGKDILKVKKPLFLHNSDFEVHFDIQFDFVVAQSIFSHTCLSLVIKGMHSIAGSLKDDGKALVTFVERPRDYDGSEEWVYPECTHFRRATIARVLEETGFYWRRLPWFHPSQTWYLLAKRREVLPSRLTCWLLLGGEEVGSTQFMRQGFLSNRFISISQPYLGSIRRVIRFMTSLPQKVIKKTGSF